MNGPHASSRIHTPSTKAAESVGAIANPQAVAMPVPADGILATQVLDRSKEKTITVKEAAFRLNKSADAVYRWLRDGRLRGWQPGGPRCAILVAEASVQEALLWPPGAGETF